MTPVVVCDWEQREELRRSAVFVFALSCPLSTSIEIVLFSGVEEKILDIFSLFH
jgi:hypothetical protein